MKKEEIDRSIDNLRAVDERIGQIAEQDPLGALFVIKNLKSEDILDGKPLIAKIIMQLAEQVDSAVRFNHAEKARILQSLILLLIEELGVKDIYNRVAIPVPPRKEAADTDGQQEPDGSDELLGDASLGDALSLFRKS